MGRERAVHNGHRRRVLSPPPRNAPCRSHEDHRPSNHKAMPVVILLWNAFEFYYSFHPISISFIFVLCFACVRIVVKVKSKLAQETCVQSAQSKQNQRSNLCNWCRVEMGLNNWIHLKPRCQHNKDDDDGNSNQLFVAILSWWCYPLYSCIGFFAAAI